MHFSDRSDFHNKFKLSFSRVVAAELLRVYLNRPLRVEWRKILSCGLLLLFVSCVLMFVVLPFVFSCSFVCFNKLFRLDLLISSDCSKGGRSQIYKFELVLCKALTGKSG